jgi:glycosyltransferase involved in cell wall biosynthesis
MKIVVAVRCYNEEKNIERFMRGYSFADAIVVSDGGSTDSSVEMLKTYPKVRLIHFEHYEVNKGLRWNPDNPHINFVLNEAKSLEPDWLIFDDMDDVPNRLLREQARTILETCGKIQVNAFRLYMWGDDQFFLQMSKNFHPDYRSLWAWKPKLIDIRADEALRHGTLIGIAPDYHGLDRPLCLLHKSWHPDTIEEKMKVYNTFGIQMEHPLKFAGDPQLLPEYAHE